MDDGIDIPCRCGRLGCPECAAALDPAMTRWVHEDTNRSGSKCLAGVRYESSAGQWVGPCLCTTPTPDPASPCSTIRFGLMCGFRATDHTPTGHPHVPARCTCGHAIKEAP